MLELMVILVLTELVFDTIISFSFEKDPEALYGKFCCRLWENFGMMCESLGVEGKALKFMFCFVTILDAYEFRNLFDISSYY